jgi:predicted MPP superfamily phosphohydrolase
MPVRFPTNEQLSARTITRRSFLVGASAAGLSLAAYGSTHARHEIEVTERTLKIHELPDAFVGFRFVQLSDIHLEEYTEAWFLQRAVETINQLNPELVLLTGDFVSRGPASDKYAWRAAGVAAEVLEGLKAPQRYACLGNHDVGVGAGHVITPLVAHGTPLLIDSYVPIQRGSDYFWLCGSDDAGTRDPDLNMAVPDAPSAPVILMCHEPDFVDHVIRHPRFPWIDAMLSGHTHGGQVRLPVLGPLILPPMGKKYIEGSFKFGDMELYVNRGLGTVGLPFRLNCPAEITHFTLARA